MEWILNKIFLFIKSIFARRHPLEGCGRVLVVPPLKWTESSVSLEFVIRATQYLLKKPRVGFLKLNDNYEVINRILPETEIIQPKKRKYSSILNFVGIISEAMQKHNFDGFVLIINKDESLARVALFYLLNFNKSKWLLVKSEDWIVSYRFESYLFYRMLIGATHIFFSLFVLKLANLFQKMKGYSKKNKGKNAPRKILIFLTTGIGDAIMATPAIREIKRNNPDATIDVLVKIKSIRDIISRFPYVDSIEVTDLAPQNVSFVKILSFAKKLRKKNYDMCFMLVAAWLNKVYTYSFISFLSGIRIRVGNNEYPGWCNYCTHTIALDTKSHQVKKNLNILKAFDYDISSKEPEFRITEKDEETVTNFLSSCGINEKTPFIVIQPTNSTTTLDDWKEENYSALIDRLSEIYDMNILLCCGKDHLKRCRRIFNQSKQKPIFVGDELDLMELAVLLKKSRVLICQDSAPSHIAAVFKVPTVVIWGKTYPCQYRPFNNPNARIIVEDLECIFRSRCLPCLKDAKCIDKISVEQVLKEVDSLMKEKSEIASRSSR